MKKKDHFRRVFGWLVITSVTSITFWWLAFTISAAEPPAPIKPGWAPALALALIPFVITIVCLITWLLDDKED